MAWGDSNEAAILERIAVAQEATLQQVTIIANKQTAIEQHLDAIRGYQKCICECCTSGAMRGELLIETTMENAQKPPAERHAIYEQELSEAGVENLTGD